MEDINLLMQGTGDAVNEHFLYVSGAMLRLKNANNQFRQASCSFAPAGWYIQERIGWPLWKIHAPVPLWDVKLRKAMER